MGAIRQLQLHRQQKRLKCTESKWKADWVMGKREGIDWKKGKTEKRVAAVQHTVKVRLMPPRGGADIRDRMSSCNVLPLPFSSSPSLLFALIWSERLWVSYDSAHESSTGQIEQISQSHPAHAEGQSSTLRACRHSFPLYRSDTLPC